MTERPQPFDAIRDNQKLIDADLSRVNQTRLNVSNDLFSGFLTQIGAKTHMTNALSTLQIVAEPHCILAFLEGEYVIGDIVSTHQQLLKDWNKKRKKGLREIPVHEVGFVSAFGFSLKGDSSTKYVRLDVLSHDWQESPKYARTLTEAGYIVLDAEYNQVK